MEVAAELQRVHEEQERSQLLLQFEEASAEEVSTVELDKLVEEYALKRKAVDEIKEQKKVLDEELDNVEMKLLSLLQKAGKTKYHVDELGTVSLVEKMSVTTPKDPADKAALFKWLKDTHGADGFLAYASVNSQSLNALYNEELGKAEDKASFNIPGIGAPLAMTQLRFKKSK